METLALIFSSLCIVGATANLVWVRRITNCFLCKTGGFALIILMFAVWFQVAHFGTEEYLNLIVANGFILITICMNLYYLQHLAINVSINRRRTDEPKTKVERRKQKGKLINDTIRL